MYVRVGVTITTATTDLPQSLFRQFQYYSHACPLDCHGGNSAIKESSIREIKNTGVISRTDKILTTPVPGSVL